MCDEYLKQWGNVKDTSRESKTRVLDKACEVFGNTKINLITVDSLRQYIKKAEKKYSDKYADAIYYALRNVFDYAVYENYLQISPMTKVKRTTDVNKVTKEMLYWEPDQFNAFISYINDLEAKTIFTFLYYMGVRKGELRALLWKDIDLKNGIAKIYKTAPQTAKTQDLLGNEDFVKRLVRYNTSLASRIYEGIKNIVSKTDTMQDIEYNFLKAFRDSGIDARTAPQYAFKTEDGSELELPREQVVENAAKVLNMEPVIEINGNRFAKNPNKNLVQMATEYFDSLGNAVYREGIGFVVLNERGAKSLVAHVPHYQDRYAAIEAIPNVLQSGEIIRVSNNWKNRGKDTVVICAPVLINGKTKYMSVIIEQDSAQKNKYYLHDLIMLGREYNKNSASSLTKTRSFSEEELAEFTYNILNEAADVKHSVGLDRVK